MTSAKAGSIVPMKVLVKQNIVPPEGIILEFLSASEHGPPPRLVTNKNADQPIRNLFSDFEQVHRVTGAGRAGNFETVAVVKIKRNQRADEYCIERYPDGSTPVGIAAEHGAV